MEFSSDDVRQQSNSQGQSVVKGVSEEQYWCLKVAAAW